MDDIVEIEDTQGETAEVSVSAPAAEIEGILIFLTSIFLLIAIILTSAHLYSAYGLGKSEGQIREEQKKMEERIRQVQQEGTVLESPK